MNEEMKQIAERLAADTISVEAYKKFLEAGDRKRYFGYVDKTMLKSMCREFKYTDAKSFIKGGIFAAVVILAINHIRKSKETESTEETIEIIDETV